MKISLFATLAVISLAAPGFAQDASEFGDVAAGEKEYNKCKACHMIQDADGTDIVKGGKTGPNLHNIIGSKIAAAEGFKFSDGLASVATANPDMVWTEAMVAEYVTDPQKWIDANGGSGRTKMTFKLNKNQPDIAAYLKSVSPDAPAE